jgi:hypothetical protein
MPLPADAAKLPPEVECFLARLTALPNAHWMAAAVEITARREAKRGAGR